MITTAAKLHAGARPRRIEPDVTTQTAPPAVREEQILRAYRVCLDPNQEHLQAMARHAGASRWAFNWALAEKRNAWMRQQQRVAELTYTDLRDLTPEQALATARARVKADNEFSVPSANTLSNRFTQERGDEQAGVDGIFPWWRGLSRYALVQGMRNAERAYQNFFDSLTGKRAGARSGFPRFKKKGRSRDSFTIFHDVKKPAIRVVDARHLRIPNLGVIRLQGNLRRLVTKLTSGRARVQSVTVAREGRRWFASVLVAETMQIRTRPTRRQKRGATVGASFGVTHLVTLSDGATFTNPRYLRAAEQRLAHAQRALSRTRRGSANHAKAVRRVGVLHAQVAERRAQNLHQITKRLTCRHAGIGIADLDVRSMTASARGTVAHPGTRVRVKSQINKAILDASFGELRRQLTYKSGWYGSTLMVTDPSAPISRTCSHCGAVGDRTGPRRTFSCQQCGTTVERGLNTARNIALLAAARPTPSPESAASLPETASTAAGHAFDKRVPEAHIGIARGVSDPASGQTGTVKREGQRLSRGSPLPSNGQASPAPPD